MIFSSPQIVSIAVAIGLSLSAQAASFPKDNSVVQYWGQNSAGAGANAQKPLATYCDDSTDAVIMSFVSDFNLGGLPSLNLANSCDGTYFPGSNLLTCPQVAEDIKTCQKKGKKVLLSLGGASGAYGFQNDNQAVKFADTIWNLFGKGNSKTRPFGDAVVDGFDLDIEGGGPTGYVALVKQLRKHFATDSSKSYYMTAAPQCPFPDAMLGSVISSVGFDAINVQFYNNYCSTGGNSFNMDVWDKWARETSPNKNVKILVGIPGSPSAAGSGYVPFEQLKPIIESVAAKYKSYGGISIWDASQSYRNTDISPNYAAAVGKLVHSGSSSGGYNPKPTSTTTSIAPSVTKSSHSRRPTKPSSSKGSSSTSSAAPAATNSPSSTCAKQGKACTTEGQYVCVGTSFAICNHGKWVVQPCAAGLTCFSTTDASSIYCAQGTGSTNSCAIASNPLSAGDPNGATAKPYKSSRVNAELSVTNSDANAFEAVINARKLDIRPFKNQVVVQFKAPKNIKVSHVSNGKVKQQGNDVKLQIRNPHKKSMAVVFTIKGKVESGVFAAPEAKSMKFSY
ncbi:Chitinase 1 [Apophysomyces ossiformis]|uniref:chitinase n=1 Tax=Apophysomyces ossiformis TaxID=679940 RepID=A0A8H7BMJ8_9FUNG|nr:Chitinase 1 [Apophysomyces ossiformis]